MTMRRRLSLLRLASGGVLFGLVFGAINALAGTQPTSTPAVAAALASALSKGGPSGGTRVVQSKQMSGRDNVVGGVGAGGGDSAAGMCNADFAEHQCAQSNFDLLGAAGTLVQGDQLSGRDSVIDGTAGGGGDSASGVCNAATAERQCDQANVALVGIGAPTLTQSNQISGRDSATAGSTAGGGGNNASGVCNAATAERQCDQANVALVGVGSPTLTQTNQISGRDSAAAGSAAGGGGNNGGGVCNAATAEHQCEQANIALVGSGSPTLTQTNQISGRDSAAAGSTAGGNGNNASGVCNAATAEHQCEQTNVAQVGGAGKAATVSQDNRITGGDSAGNAGSAAGDNASGVCNAATAKHQCDQTNVAKVAQGGGGDHSADVSQSNEISGQDVCNAATAAHQCEQTNVAKVSQSGGGANTAAVRQNNQSAGQGGQQTNVAEIRQSGSGSNTSSVSQSNQTSHNAGAAEG
jgi:hypothetical protein